MVTLKKDRQVMLFGPNRLYLEINMHARRIIDKSGHKFERETEGMFESI